MEKEIIKQQSEIHFSRSLINNFTLALHSIIRIINMYLQDTNIKQSLSKEESTSVYGFRTSEECTNAIFQMKLNKSLDLDGRLEEF